MNLRYVVEVKKNTVVFTVDPATVPGAFPGPRAPPRSAGRRRRTGSWRTCT